MRPRLRCAAIGAARGRACTASVAGSRIRRRSSGGRRRRASVTSEKAGVARNHRVRKRGKCGHLRRFLIDTFGAETLRRGPVLDVGGGRGELAFELEDLNDVRSSSSTPCRSASRSSPRNFAADGTIAQRPCSAITTPPRPRRTTAEDQTTPGADDQARVVRRTGACCGRRTCGLPPRRVNAALAARVAVYRAWAAARWFDSETRARTTPKTAREESPERFARWPSAPTRRRKRRASPVTGMSRVFPVMGMLTPPPTLPVMEMSTMPVMPSPRVTAGTSRAVPLRRMPTAIRAALRDCSAVVGLHSDHATEWIVDFALERGIPFAVVPCLRVSRLVSSSTAARAPVSTPATSWVFSLEGAGGDWGCPARVRREGSRGVLDVGGNEGGRGRKEDRESGIGRGETAS